MRFSLVFLLFLTSFFGCSQEPKNCGQELHLNLSTEPPSLDPRKASDSTSCNVLIALYEGLTRYDLNNTIQAALAENIEVSEDKRTYTFTLKPSLWSNGEKVTAYDFLYAWHSMLDPLFPSPFAYKLFVFKNGAEIKKGNLPLSSLGVSAPDEKTLICTLEHPVPHFLELLAFPSFFPINAHCSKEATITNGPFILEKWAHENEIVLVKNPLFWDAPNVFLEKISFSMIEDATTEFYMFESGELDWAGSPLSNLPGEILPALQHSKKLSSYPLAGVYYYTINTEIFPFTHKKIRKALSLAIDRQALVNHILQTEELPAATLLPPTAIANKEEFESLFDPVKAKILFEEGLQELKVAKESLPPIVLSFNCNREHQKIAQVVQQQWIESFGLNVALEAHDWKVYLDKLAHQDYQIGRMGWLGDTTDPLNFLEPFQYKNNALNGGNNNTGWEDPLFSELLEKAKHEIDVETRTKLLLEAEKKMIEEQPVIPLYYYCAKYLKNPRIKDVYLSPLGTIDFRHAYLEEKQ